MPGSKSHFIPPFRSIYEFDMDSGEDPCGIGHYKVIIAESKMYGVLPCGLLRKVHERSRLEAP